MAIEDDLRALVKSAQEAVTTSHPEDEGDEMLQAFTRGWNKGASAICLLVEDLLEANDG